MAEVKVRLGATKTVSGYICSKRNTSSTISKAKAVRTLSIPVSYMTLVSTVKTLLQDHFHIVLDLTSQHILLLQTLESVPDIEDYVKCNPISVDFSWSFNDPLTIVVASMPVILEEEVSLIFII
jgi:hypothetical protein